jgi:pyridoxal 5'-phosphate synthase pdxS subunit
MADTGTCASSGLAEMLKGGVIMDVVDAEQADRRGRRRVRGDGARARPGRHSAGRRRRAHVRPEKITEIQEAVTIPVMAKCRIGHFVQAQILQALEIDYIDESGAHPPTSSTTSTSGTSGAVRLRLHNLGEALGASPRAR